jgi:Mn-dependent DtxR family transcriptional regulator
LKKKPLTAAGFEEIKTQLLGILQKGPIRYSSLSDLLKNKKDTQVLEVLEDLQAAEIVQIDKNGIITLR